MYEGEVTELAPVETENPGGGYGKVRRLAGWLAGWSAARLPLRDRGAPRARTGRACGRAVPLARSELPP